VRITQPKEHEPIRLVPTTTGPRYRAVLDIAPKGAPRRQVTRTFGTLREARTFVVNTRSGLTTGDYTAPNAETVTALCERWLTTRRDIRPVTLEGYTNHLGPVLRFLGDRRVQDLTVTDVEHLVAWMTREGGKRGQALAPRSVKGALVALGQALDMAMREGTIGRNPARLARRPRMRKVAGTDLEHWQPAELIRWLDHADTDPLAGVWRLTGCGMTRADLMGLRWTDVDLSLGTASVSQGRVALDTGDHIDDPKSESRRRVVPFEQVWPGTTDLLRALRARQAADRLRAGAAYADTGLVVVDALGCPVRPEWFSDQFRRLCRTAGVPSIRLHSVRHSLAFWLHQVGVSPADASALLGHTVEVHLSTYLPHSGASGITAAARALGQAARGMDRSLAAGS
jgi:integrase